MFSGDDLAENVDFDRDLIPNFNINDRNNDREKENPREALFKCHKKFSLASVVPGAGIQVVTAVYHKEKRLFVTGHSNGTFVIHEMPEFCLIHCLNMSDKSVTALDINLTGDWLAVASSHLGQLIVWEWQSETFVMKQQGHFHDMNCVSYSPDGQFVATGGQDAKVKVWTVENGFCFVTFGEHTGNITGLAWTQGGKAVVSSSLDGTVRAFDLKRYRNFRTFVSPEPVQFSCVAVDRAGDLVCAGCQDVFDIFVWSLNTGRLLEILTGHEAPVNSLDFNPTNSMLVSGSWDKTMRLWDIVDSKQSKEIITHTSDVLNVQFSPDGLLVGCCTLNSQIYVYEPVEAQQIACIEGRLDLDIGRGATDDITQKKLTPSKSFTALCFSPNSEFIIAGGASRYICIYHVAEQILVKKFQVTHNRSLNYVAYPLTYFPQIDKPEIGVVSQYNPMR
uniref:Uncharacterized protein n=1 Tax=Romanomermis culicivorax TaxID=13658 RepID=A0A915KR73_ROMCU